MRPIQHPLEYECAAILANPSPFILVPTVMGSWPCEDGFKLAEAMAKRENEAAAAVHVKLELEQDRGALKCPMLLCYYPVASVNTLLLCLESHTSDQQCYLIILKEIVGVGASTIRKWTWNIMCTHFNLGCVWYLRVGLAQSRYVSPQNTTAPWRLSYCIEEMILLGKGEEQQDTSLETSRARTDLPFLPTQSTCLNGNYRRSFMHGKLLGPRIERSEHGGQRKGQRPKLTRTVLRNTVWWFQRSIGILAAALRRWCRCHLAAFQGKHIRWKRRMQRVGWQKGVGVVLRVQYMAHCSVLCYGRILMGVS